MLLKQQMQWSPPKKEKSFLSLKPLSTFHPNMRPLPNNRKSDDLKAKKGMKLDKLKMELNDYLLRNQYQTTMKSPTKFNRSGDERLKKVLEGSEGRKSFANNKRQPKKSYFHQERQRKDKQVNDEEEDFCKMYKKSFTIKEIHPVPKYKIKNEAEIFSEPKYGKIHGNYEQIIAIQKKYDQSKYFPKFDNKKSSNIQVNTSMNLKYRYTVRMNPSSSAESAKKKLKLSVREYDGTSLQPWQNAEQHLESYIV